MARKRKELDINKIEPKITLPSATTLPTFTDGETPINKVTMDKLNAGINQNRNDLESVASAITQVDSQLETVKNKVGDRTQIYLTQDEYNQLSDNEKNDITKMYNISIDESVLKTQSKEIIGAINELYLKIKALETNNPTTNYTITNTLVNCKTNNNTSSIRENNPYSAIITANENYSINKVSITMGDVDITSTSYSNGTIAIDKVTGNITINISAINTSITPPSNEPIYTLTEAKVFNGTNNFDTGIKLFDSNKDFSIFIDFIADSSTSHSNNIPSVVMSCKKETSPWFGTNIACFSESSATGGEQDRGNIVGNTKNGYVCGKMYIGKSKNYYNQQKLIIIRNTTDNKFYIYDGKGLIGSYEIAYAQNNLNLILANNPELSGDSYWKGTISQLKVWEGKLQESEINSLLGIV